MKKRIVNNSGILAVLWALVIFILCATPGQYIPSADWLELLSFDKFVHAAIFFILTSLLLLVATRSANKRILIVVFFILAVAYGASLEIMQAKYFSNRSADFYDMIANSVGCLMALVFRKRISIYLTMSSNNKKPPNFHETKQDNV